MIAMGQRPPVLVGEKVLWLGSGSGLPQSGVVRWIGQLPEIGPDWAVGIELDEELPYGGIDGRWCGRVLFTCRAKHGLIVPISSIIPTSKIRFIQTSCDGGNPDNENDIQTDDDCQVKIVTDISDSFKKNLALSNRNCVVRDSELIVHKEVPLTLEEVLENILSANEEKEECSDHDREIPATEEGVEYLVPTLSEALKSVIVSHLIKHCNAKNTNAAKRTVLIIYKH